MNIEDKLRTWLKAEHLDVGDKLTILDDLSLSLEDISFIVMVSAGGLDKGSYKWQPNISMLNQIVTVAGTFNTMDFLGLEVTVAGYTDTKLGRGWSGLVTKPKK